MVRRIPRNRTESRGIRQRALGGGKARFCRPKAAHSTESGACCHAEGRGFESHQPLRSPCKSAPFLFSVPSAGYAEGSGFEAATDAREMPCLGCFADSPVHSHGFGRHLPWLADDWLTQHRRRHGLARCRQRPRVSPPSHPSSPSNACAETCRGLRWGGWARSGCTRPPDAVRRSAISASSMRRAARSLVGELRPLPVAQGAGLGAGRRGDITVDEMRDVGGGLDGASARRSGRLSEI
jgi:hypothetical protein